MTNAFWIVAGYLAGSCPTGFLVAKYIYGADIRGFGSGNIGATNVGRLMGKRWAVAVAVFDMLKGGLTVLAASRFVSDPAVLALTGLCAVLGHNFPFWLGFKGGKGVATTFGVIGFYDFFLPWPAILGGVVWYVVMKTTKYVSVASIVGLFSAAALTFFFGMPAPYVAASFLLAALSTWRHRANIERLRKGTESKVK
ncbi:MAG: glycerol-3-phosphate 1-O-acyltransferase PlsY [Synergistaceae bacterium]|nr:glycerol-3-phosphate 1-O-acyltransferase PlsY [Synergistaceae bacterium]